MNVIRIDDIRKAGYCASGAKRWFKANRLDFRAFLNHGIEEQVFLDTGDALAAEVVKRKRERAARGQT